MKLKQRSEGLSLIVAVTQRPDLRRALAVFAGDGPEDVAGTIAVARELQKLRLVRQSEPGGVFWTITPLGRRVADYLESQEPVRA